MTNLLDRQTLLLDADDTLWENNVFYEHAIEEFIDFLAHERLTRAEIRAVLDRFEIANGYGARAFARSLRQTFEEVSGEHDEDALRHVEQLGLRILQIDIEIIAGVEETLTALRPHHDLFLFTKGELEEQRLKIGRSGIAHYSDAHIIAAEKTTPVFVELADSMDLDPEQTWMVGNSRRSDIQPALEAGLHAVYVPHAMTWHLEHAEIRHSPGWHGRYVEIERFTDLRSVFRSSDAAGSA